jgi:hypothetical protein
MWKPESLFGAGSTSQKRKRFSLETWVGPKAHETGAATWATSADEANDLVFIPTSSPSRIIVMANAWDRTSGNSLAHCMLLANWRGISRLYIMISGIMILLLSLCLQPFRMAIRFR